MSVSAVIIGGGPAGAVAGRLLAAWGHRVVVLQKDETSGGSGGDTAAARSRGLAESIPPSARKLLAQAGVLEAVDAAGFYRSTGNTVWWGSEECRQERFDAFDSHNAAGLQVFRPEFDRLLLECARSAGAEVQTGATVRAVRAVDFDGNVDDVDDVDQVHKVDDVHRVDDVHGLDDGAARIEYEHRGRRHALTCDIVLDCSGRAGVLARPFRRSGHRTCALVGVWRAENGWHLPDETHTIVEAYDRGWAWSVPIAATVRHTGVMIGEYRRSGDRVVGDQGFGGVSTRLDGRSKLAGAYRAELQRTSHLRRHLDAATLADVWACDASTYDSSRYTGPRFLLVGDAGSFIDPLSSFGVKKALGSAWMAAVAVNTCLRHPERRRVALELFSSWEREVFATYTARSRDFARTASARYPHPFWVARAGAGAAPNTDPASTPDVAHVAQDPAVRAALRRIQESHELDVALDERVTYEQHPVIRGHEIVLEDALPGGVRFFDHVDLVTLARLAGQYRQVPDLFDAYCRMSAPVPLPQVLGGLSVLMARGLLVERNAIRFEDSRI